MLEGDIQDGKSHSLRGKFYGNAGLTGALIVSAAGLGLWVSIALGNALQNNHTVNPGTDPSLDDAVIVGGRLTLAF